MSDRADSHAAFPSEALGELEAASLDAIEAALDHRFGARRLLETALRHSSRAHEEGGVESNERLEFLGDAVLEIAVAELLYEAHPSWSEGDLTRGLHQLVDKASLAGLARGLGVGEHLRLGRTERQSSGHEKDSILADAMEALLGAMYLDAGLEPVRRLLLHHFAAAFAPDAPRARRDPKTELQERSMAEGGRLPRYQLVGDSGIDGDENRFTCEVRLDGEAVGRGVGRSKRVAERRAAAEALDARDRASAAGEGERDA